MKVKKNLFIYLFLLMIVVVISIVFKTNESKIKYAEIPAPGTTGEVQTIDSQDNGATKLDSSAENSDINNNNNSIPSQYNGVRHQIQRWGF